MTAVKQPNQREIDDIILRARAERAEYMSGLVRRLFRKPEPKAPVAQAA